MIPEALDVLAKHLQDSGATVSKTTGDSLIVAVEIPKFVPFIDHQVSVHRSPDAQLHFNVTLQFEYLTCEDHEVAEQYQDQVSAFENEWLPVIRNEFSLLIDQYGLKLNLEYQNEVDVDIYGTFSGMDWQRVVDLIGEVQNVGFDRLAHTMQDATGK